MAADGGDPGPSGRLHHGQVDRSGEALARRADSTRAQLLGPGDTQSGGGGQSPVPRQGPQPAASMALFGKQQATHEIREFLVFFFPNRA